jgi:hypothetical protein
MKYVFDIDGTICSDTKGDYQTATPILERIEIINQRCKRIVGINISLCYNTMII